MSLSPSPTAIHEAGGYRYIPAVFQYSGGVAAQPGFRIERARLFKPLPMAAGFDAIAQHLASLGRPNAAFCACELRSPEPFTEAGFTAFNRLYVGRLREWGIMTDEVNPVARTNVCPELDKPAEPSLYAFSYTVPDVSAPRGSFVVAGSGEAPEGKGSYRDHTIRLGDVSPSGMRAKAEWVMGEMERRLASLGFQWSDTTNTHIYTVHDIHPFLPDLLVGRGAARKGVSWHYVRPPVADLDYEMDTRGVFFERTI
ncbi:MAG: hypothetical protein WCH83_16055 [Alphaproteobacteria bacterium]